MLFRWIFLAIALGSIYISIVGAIAPFGGIKVNGYSSFFVNLEFWQGLLYWQKAKIIVAAIAVYGIFGWLWIKFNLSLANASRRSQST